MKFHILDVFGSKPYTGNQLAVFSEIDHLSTEEMQSIAQEIHFSESTFITGKNSDNGTFTVRIFTPGAEVDFAGHPTLGTAYVIGRLFYDVLPDTVVLNLKAGQIPVSLAGDTLWMKQNQPVFGKIFPFHLLAGVLGLNNDDFIERFPAQEVSTGLPFTIVPVKSLETLKKAKIQRDQYDKFIQDISGKGIMIFCPEGHTSHHDMSSRVFVDYLGIPEDPATGSATGCLAAWLIKHQMLGYHKIEITIGQGYEMGRPSELQIKADINNGQYTINIGGKVFEIAEGFWGNKS